MICAQSFSSVQFFVAARTVALQASLSMGFSGKNTGVGCHFLLQGNFPNPGIKPASPWSPALAGRFFFFFLTIEPPGKPLNNITAAKIQRYNLASDLKCYLFVKIPIYYKPSRGRKEKQIQFSSVQFSCSVVSDSLQPCGLQQARPPCPSPTPRVYSNSCPLSQ